MGADSPFGPVVSADWLRAHRGEVRVADVRWYLNPPDGRTGTDAYRAGHIPGAVWLDIDTDLSAPPSGHAGRHPLPDPAHFAAALGAHGIAEAQPVVAYDDSGGGTAARLWWMLHVLGEPVAVLDGGLDAWLAAGGELSTQPPRPTAVARVPRPWPPDRFVTADELAASGAAVFDARTAERFARGDESIDPRPGHIPGARSVPWAANLGADGRLLAPGELRELYAAATERGAIAYCGSGVSACHTLLAMTRAGLRELALYPGSWSQWGADPSRPAETS